MALRGSSRHLWFPAAVLLLAGIGVLGIHFLRGDTPSATPLAGNLRHAPGDPHVDEDGTPVPPARPADQAGRMSAGDPQVSEPNEQGAGRIARPAPIAYPAPEARPPLPGYAIRGKVLAKDGPIREEPGQWPRTLVVQVEAPAYTRHCRIDSEGRFECEGLDAGVYVVSVASLPPQSGLLCQAIEVPLGPASPLAELALILSDEVPVAVTVVEAETLGPAFRETVVARSVDGRNEVTVGTDEQGCCVLSLIPGQYWIAPRRWGDRQEADPQLLVVEPEAQDLAVQLFVPARRQSRIRGVLVDAQGNPVDGYVDLDLVASEPDRQPANTFAIADPGFRDPDGLLAYACDVSGQLARRFICSEEAWHDGMKVVLEPRARIVGRLLGEDGLPVAAGHLALELSGSGGRWRSEDKLLFTPAMSGDGAFQIDGVPVGLDVRVAATAGRHQGQSGPLELRPGQTHDAGDIVVKAPERPASRGVVRGRIVDESGQPLLSPVVWVWSEGKWAQGLMDLGWFWVSGVRSDRPVTIRVVVPGVGSGSRTTVGGDWNCLFQIDSQGWGLLGAEATPLVVDRWINHAPMTWEQLRGRVVLLTFRDLDRDSPDDRNLSATLSVCREYHSRGLVVVAVYGHVPVNGSVTSDQAVGRILSLFQGAPIAGCLDADPGLVADLMPSDDLDGAFAGATHSLYQVYVRPTMFLVDKQGRLRCCVDQKALREQIDMLLQE